MKPVSFASIGECMIELSAGKGDLWRMGFAGDTFNTACYARATLPRNRRVLTSRRSARSLFATCEKFSPSRHGGDRPHPEVRRGGLFRRASDSANYLNRKVDSIRSDVFGRGPSLFGGKSEDNAISSIQRPKTVSADRKFTSLSQQLGIAT